MRAWMALALLATLTSYAHGNAVGSSAKIDQAERNVAVAVPTQTSTGERAVVEETIRDAIGWALTKDQRRLESIMAHDSDFFIFHPDSKSTVRGWEAFARMIPAFMDPRFKATRFEVNDLAITFSRSGEVAWYSANLEDCGEWNSQPSCWKDTRWTGVLEKREGRWLIVQMHFSFAKDKVLRECPGAEAK